MPTFENLSSKQQEIIQSRNPVSLILAGPGTGKTEILAHRIVDIINYDRDVEPHEIMALTFSRKATVEMRNRLDEFQEVDTSEVKISTIHAESLRTYYQLGGIRRHILDADELNMLVRDTLDDNRFSSRRRDVNKLKKEISKNKSRNLLPDEIISSKNDEVFVKLYKYYEKLLEYHDAMDFNDVILKPVRMLSLKGVNYDKNIKHLLIDEFQDINTLEFHMLQILGKSVEGLFIVGDDDQSIYGFRDADPTLIKTIEKYYPDCINDCLELTHRCCEHIIRGALEIVSKDKNYVPKPIHSARGQGTPIKLLYTRSEGAEAAWIAEWIRDKINSGYVEPQKIGILSKSHDMIPIIIAELKRRDIDVTRYVSGGIFRHKPVRDILSVGRLMVDHSDNLAFRKCLSTNLASGIGQIGIKNLRTIAEEKHVDYWDVIMSIDSYPFLRRWKKSYSVFLSIIEQMYTDAQKMENEEIIEMIGTALGVYGEEGVEKLTEQVRSFETSIPFNTVLSSIQSNRGLDKAGGGAEPEGQSQSVAVMTMHAAKGLTFDVVFIIGMDQEILPDSTQEIDEQRRLCYVAMTRARNDLFLCHTRKRTGTIARGISFYTYSDFIEEISSEHKEIIDQA